MIHRPHRQSPNPSARGRIGARLLSLLVPATLMLANPGCDQSPQPSSTTATEASKELPPQPVSESVRAAWSFYHIHGVDALAQAVACVNELKSSVATLIKATEMASLDNARNQLARCKNRYLVTRVFVAADDKARAAMDSLHQKIAAPLDMPGFIDAVPGYPYSGIVNDTSLPITRDELLNQHGLTDVSDVSLGFSVIEFLLWGIHAQQPEAEPRLLEDFMAKTSWDSGDYELGLVELDITEHPQNRRRRYLEMAVMLVEEHLNQLATDWNKHTQPPQYLSAADRLAEQIKTRIKERLSAANAAGDETLLATLLPLFTLDDNQGSDASHFIQWLKLSNTVPQEPDALSVIRDAEIPLSTKYSALQSLLGVTDPQNADAPTDDETLKP